MSTPDSPQHSVALKPGDRVAERYEVVELIAGGAMGVIYRVNDAQTGQPAALKVLRYELSADPVMSKRFMREAATTQRLSHPMIITHFDHGRDHARGLLYLVTEWLEGDDLARTLARGGRLEPERAARIGAAVAEALGAAHAEGIIHRDLKPANIFVTRDAQGDERVKVLDFGIAKIANDPAQEQLTRTGKICGTAEFMSPEQARGEAIDGRSDVYALGCVLHSMLTGAAPFASRDPMQVILKHQREPLPALPEGTPAALQAIITRATQKDPADRHADAVAVGRALERFLRGEQTPAPTPPGAGRGARGEGAGLQRVLLIMAGALLLLVAGLALYLLTRGS